jgi:hypothetical protein
VLPEAFLTKPSFSFFLSGSLVMVTIDALLDPKNAGVNLDPLAWHTRHEWIGLVLSPSLAA